MPVPRVVEKPPDEQPIVTCKYEFWQTVADESVMVGLTGAATVPDPITVMLNSAGWLLQGKLTHVAVKVCTPAAEAENGIVLLCPKAKELFGPDQFQ